TEKILKGEMKGPMRHVVVLNAGFAISAYDDCTLKEGFDKAEQLIASQSGYDRLQKLKALSNSFKV
ncbi:MAG: anthranilate phosphoribosyltransferase, partial [Deltaproteobacteria bacterium]|nr:anthranilate phosphoribosyltransferase [Deltaproteobacteria bacterium]